MQYGTRKWLLAGLAIALGMSSVPLAVAANAADTPTGNASTNSRPTDDTPTNSRPTDDTPTNSRPSAQTHTGPLTIEQAVAQVQRKTHGKVLRTNSRRYGNVTEYWIKVLTPDGRVRVISLRSQPAPAPAAGSQSEENH